MKCYFVPLAFAGLVSTSAAAEPIDWSQAAVSYAIMLPIAETAVACGIRPRVWAERLKRATYKAELARLIHRIAGIR